MLFLQLRWFNGKNTPSKIQQYQIEKFLKEVTVVTLNNLTQHFGILQGKPKEVALNEGTNKVSSFRFK